MNSELLWALAVFASRNSRIGSFKANQPAPPSPPLHSVASFHTSSAYICSVTLLEGFISRSTWVEIAQLSFYKSYRSVYFLAYSNGSYKWCPERTLSGHALSLQSHMTPSIEDAALLSILVLLQAWDQLADSVSVIRVLRIHNIMCLIQVNCAHLVLKESRMSHTVNLFL